MERAHISSSFENIGDVQTNLRKRSTEKQVQNSSRGFRRKFTSFRIGDIDDVVLFAGDFTAENRADDMIADASIKIIDDSSGDTVTPVRYFDVFKRFRRIIDRDLSTDDFDTGITRSIKPGKETEGLKAYIEQNPEAKVKVRYLLMRLEASEDETEQIIVSRYLNSETGVPIAEVWHAHRTRNVYVSRL